MPNSDPQLRDMLERIAKKIESSPALNGGFDKMMATVEHIKEKQEQTGENVEKIHNALYEPDTGFFARVKYIEHQAENLNEKFEEHAQEDVKFYTKLEIQQNQSQPVELTVKKLQTIAGDDLKDLESAIKIKKNLDRLYWAIVLGCGSILGKFAYEYLSLHILK